MSYPLPYQGHPPSTGLVADPTSSIADGSSPLVRNHALPLTDGSPQSSTSRVRKSRFSKGKDVGKQIHRSISTPQLKASGSMSDSDQDKKRNKLGYQRISIACAHCRRRKIRCIPADADAQNRCQNCIRLRKECVYYPVDQHNVVDGQSQPSTKTGDGAAQGPGSPSPSEPGRPSERMRQFGSFPSLPSNAPPGPYQLSIEPGSALPVQCDFVSGFRQQGTSDINAGRGAVVDFRYNSTDSRQHWARPGEISPQGPPMGRTDEAIASPYWRTSPTAMQADFAPFPTATSAMAQALPEAAYAFHQPQLEMQNWQTQQPSAPAPLYAHGQGSAQPGFPPPQMMYQGNPVNQSGSATYPPLDMGRAISHPPISGPYSAPVGTPITQYGHPQAFMYQPHPQVAESPLSNQQQFSGQWYQDRPAYGQVPSHGQQRPSDQGHFTSRPP